MGHVSADERSGSGAERQVVGICLRYPEAADSVDLSKDDFTDRVLGRLFEACRLIPEKPSHPGPWPTAELSELMTMPFPAKWAAWLVEVEDWRPRQAARLVMVDPSYAVALHDASNILGTLPRYAAEVKAAAVRHKVRLACTYAIQLADEGAPPEEIKAVLSGMV